MSSLKLNEVKKIWDLHNHGKSLREIAREVSCGHQTVGNWVKRIAECGDCEAALEAARSSKGGRPKAIEFTDLETNLARWYRLTKESLDVAAYFFIRSDERDDATGKLIVRPETAEAMRTYEEKAFESKSKRAPWPMSVKRCFHVTDEELALFRGEKAHQQTEMITRRGMFELLPNGTQVEILPGMVWELDDYSTNQPYWHSCPESSEINVNRQVLAAKDLSAAKWLGFDHIGRERDAYRGEDILRFIERLIRVHGVPSKLRLERGAWESSYIHGIDVPGLATPWGDLRDLMEIHHVFKSKGKAIIEGGFSVLQRWLGHTGIDIGRKRGEFEEAAKRLRQSRNVTTDAKTLGFLSITESSNAHESAARILNSRPMAREHLNESVAPDDLVNRLGWNTRKLQEDDAWYFYACKQLRVVKAGQVRVKPGGGWAPIYFTINGILDGLHLETGHKVLIACDPAKPELGARICNADQSPKNRIGFGMGEVIHAAAPYHGLAPQFSAAKDLTPHLLARRNATAAARTSFRAITSTGKGSSMEVAAFNGSGDAVHAGNLAREIAEPITDNTPDTKTVPASRAPQLRNESGGRGGALGSRGNQFSTPEARAAEIARLSGETADV